MAIIYLDSFDGYTTAEIGTYWFNNAAGVGGQISTSSGDARTGTGCYRPPPSGVARGLHSPPIGNVTFGTGTGSLKNEVIIGAAIKMDLAASTFIFQFQLSRNAALGGTPDADLTSSFVQGSLHINNDQTLRIAIGTGPGAITLGVTNVADVVHPTAYNYYEWHVQFGTSGFSEVRINNKVVQSGNIMQSAVPVTIGTASTVNRDKAEMFLIASLGGGGAPVAYDDLYILDPTTGTNTTYFGDSRVNCFMPSGTGSNTQFTTFGSASNWQNVNEIPADDDTTYNFGTASGKIDDYAHTTLATNSLALNGVQSWAKIKDPDGSNTTFGIVLDSSGTVYVTNTNTAASTYTEFQEVWDTIGTTTTGWTAADFNASTFGVEDLG